MSTPNNWTIEEIQTKLEDLIYGYVAVDAEKNRSINLVAKEELTEEEKTRFNEYRKNLSNDFEEEAKIDFYKIQDKAQPKAHLGITLESHDSNPISLSVSFSTQSGRKFSYVGKEKPNKELFKKLIEMGWKIPFQYTCSLESIFDESTKVAKLILNTIQLFDMYSWEVSTQENGED